VIKQQLTQFFQLCRRNKLLTAVVIALALLLLVLVSTPHLIAYEFKKWVLANGGDAVTVENVDFNPFTAKLALENISIERAGEKPFLLPQLNLHAVWSSLFQRKLVFNSISIDGVRLEINQTDPQQSHVGGILLHRLLNGEPEPEPQADDKPWRILLKTVELDDIEIIYQQAPLRSVLKIEQLRLNGLDSHPDAAQAEIEFAGALDAAPVKISGQMALFAKQPSFQGNIVVESLDIHPYAAFASEQLKALESHVSIDSQLDFKQVSAGQFHVKQQGKFALADNAWADDQIKLNSKLLDWQGNLDIETGHAQAFSMRADGQLGSRQLQLSNREPGLQLGHAALDWQGVVNLTQQPDQQLGAAIKAMQLTLDHVVVNSADKQQLLKLGQISLRQLDMPNLQQISLAAAELSDVTIGSPQKIAEAGVELAGFAGYGKLQFEAMQYSAADGISIQRILQQDMQVLLEMGESGEWNFQPFLNALEQLTATDAEAAPQQPVVSEAADDNMHVVIDKFVIGENSRLYFVDRSAAKPLIQRITIQQAQLQPINTAQPDVVGKLLLKAVLGEDAILDVNGDVAVFAADPTFDLKATIQNLSLLPYSQYMEKSFGYEVDSGELNADISVAASKGQLKASNELVLQQLDIKALSPEQLEQLGAKLNSGLESGLSMLKDKNDTIKLSVPVEGALNDLKVDPSDIINQALGSALKRGAKTYFAAALFPFGTLLVVADMATDKAMRVTLDPVFFETTSSSMDSKYRDYLDKVAGILRDKPEIFVKVCGVAVTADRQQLVDSLQQAHQKKLAEQQAKAGESEQKADAESFVVPEEQLATQLKALAKQRASTVENYLIEQNKVSTQRLIQCQPKLDLDKADARGRTELSL
jgi:hypothetical protein